MNRVDDRNPVTNRNDNRNKDRDRDVDRKSGSYKSNNDRRGSNRHHKSSGRDDSNMNKMEIGDSSESKKGKNRYGMFKPY